MTGQTGDAERQAPLCMICENPRPEGIHICGQFLCSECEEEIVRTNVEDEKYPFFITRMKRVWHLKKDA